MWIGLEAPFGSPGGALLVLLFIIYISSVPWAIYKGILMAPDSDRVSEDSESTSPRSSYDDEASRPRSNISNLEPEYPKPPQFSASDLNGRGKEYVPLAPETFHKNPQDAKSGFLRKVLHSTLYHPPNLSLGFLALSLSGYIISHSITTLGTTFSLSSTVLGMTILSFATTLPEKVVALVPGSRQQGGIMIANTVGSNILLFILCAGILFLAGDLEALMRSVTMFEVIAIWLALLALLGIVMVEGRKWMSWLLFGFYTAFIFLDFVVDRK